MMKGQGFMGVIYININKMKPRSHIRIVCLKNEHSQQKNMHYHSGLIVSGGDGREIEEERGNGPSLAYLSARLQFGNNKEGSELDVSRLGRSGVTSLRTLEMTQTQSRKTPYDAKFPTIQTYFQTQSPHSNVKRATIRNMMGQIDFSLDRHKQKKVARTLRNTIDRVTGDNKFTKKKKFEDMENKKVCSSQNRPFLVQDFHTFLRNKNEQFIREKEPKIDETERVRLKRLAVTNPEKQKEEQDKAEGSADFELSLYRFQDRSEVKKREPTLASLLKTTPANIAKSRLQKKMFKMALNQTDQQQFTWSRMPKSQAFQIPK